MAKDKKIKRFRHIPFKDPQDMNMYMKLRNADDPDKLAVDLGIVDKKKIKRLARLLFGIFLIIHYYNVIYYVVF